MDISSGYSYILQIRDPMPPILITGGVVESTGAATVTIDGTGGDGTRNNHPLPFPSFGVRISLRIFQIWGNWKML